MKKSVIIFIKGGIGNQVFQYAFARSLALRHNKELYLDISSLEGKGGNKYRKTYEGYHYRLNKYCITGKYLPRFQSNYINVVRKKKLYKVFNVLASVRVANNLLPYYVKEDDFGTVNIGKYHKICFDGYWQDFDYFSGHIAAIREEFTLKDELSADNRKLLDQIESTDSVSVHFIRGIKIYDPKHQQRYHQSSIEYFLYAYSFMRERISSPQFFAFSNEIDWVKKHWPKDKPIVFVDNNGPDYEHHFLMSRCKHNIVDNSTFSYTAAYLNRNPHKIVIAPRIWSKTKKFRNPESWIIMDNE